MPFLATLTAAAVAVSGFAAPAHADIPARHSTANTAANAAELGERIVVPLFVSDAMNDGLAALGYDDATIPVFRGQALDACATDSDCELAEFAPAVEG